MYYSFTSSKVFHINVSWWAFTGVWMTVSLLKSPGLFSVFLLILIILSFGWSPLVLLFPSFLVSLLILWALSLVHQTQLVSPSPLCSIAYKFSTKVLALISLVAFFYFHSVVCRNGKVNYSAGSVFFVFLLTITRTGRLAEIKWSVCISKSQRSLCISFSKTDSGLCIYHFLHSSQWITFPTQSFLVFYPFYANLLHWLLYDWSFHLYNQITYTCYIVASSLFLL